MVRRPKINPGVIKPGLVRLIVIVSSTVDGRRLSFIVRVFQAIGRFFFIVLEWDPFFLPSQNKNEFQLKFVLEMFFLFCFFYEILNFVLGVLRCGGASDHFRKDRTNASRVCGLSSWQLFAWRRNRCFEEKGWRGSRMEAGALGCLEELADIPGKLLIPTEKVDENWSI